MRRPLVAGNWKMNGSRAGIAGLLGAVRAGAAQTPGVDIAVCPPFVYLAEVESALAGGTVAWGGQNLCQEAAAGAFTGEISGAMLRDFGCRYVIIGHSERRTLYGEGDALVARKFIAATAAGLVPLLCVGELLEERENGTTEAVIARQLDAVLDAVDAPAALERAVVAYEPVWAIGTGRTASPAQAQEVHDFIRRRIARRDAGAAAALRILYGGSVKGSNAAELFAMEDIDGGLIGGASLKAEEFLEICRAAQAA
ncbi:MAG: triose-phosphate isomerase [Acetobacteraceae bacterium]